MEISGDRNRIDYDVENKTYKILDKQIYLNQ